MGLAAFDGLEITLHHAVITQGTKLPHMVLADAAARAGKTLQGGFSGKPLVEGDQFAHLMARGVAVSGLNGRQFQRKQQLCLIIVQEQPQRAQILDRFEAQPFRNCAQAGQTIRRPKLMSQRMPVAQPFGRVAQRQLCRLHHSFARQVRSEASGYSPYRIYPVPPAVRMPAVKSRNKK